MQIVDNGNGHSVASNGHPLGIRCECGHRALVPLDRIARVCGPGSMRRVRDLKWLCSKCGSREIDSISFANLVQALAFSDGLSYADVFDLRFHGKDITAEPWCWYLDRPNPYVGGPHDPPILEPVQPKRPESRWKVERARGVSAYDDVDPTTGCVASRSHTEGI